MIANVMKRAAAVSMTVYLSDYLGVWGKAEDSERLLKSMGVPVGSIVKWILPSDELDWQAEDVYNKGVKKSFAFIRHIPEHVSNTFDYATLACKFVGEEVKLVKRGMASLVSDEKVWKLLSRNPSQDPIMEAEEQQASGAVEAVELVLEGEDAEQKPTFMELSYRTMWHFWKDHNSFMNSMLWTQA